MLLYVTQRPAGPTIERRCSSFRALGIAFTHVPLQDPAAPTASAQRYYPDKMPFGARAAALLRGVFKLRRTIRHMRAGDVIYVALLDCLLAVLAARALSGNRTPVICEIHDVHALLLGRGALGAVARAVQRFALSRVALLIVPSRANIDLYYRPIAGYRGATAVVHNVVVSGEVAAPLPSREYDGTWRIGWFCGLRCRRSLEIVRAAAGALGDKVEFVLAGQVNGDISAEMLRDAIEDLPNVVYLGNYHHRDLAALYGGVDLAFALHFEPPDKSVWALATRIFEAGAHGRPSLARAGTEMGRFVTEHAIGWALQEPCEETLVRFLERLTPDDYAAMADAVRRTDATLFSGEAQLAAALACVMPAAQAVAGREHVAKKLTRPA